MTREKHSTRREILNMLKRKGSLSVDELSQYLGITPMGIRQHLAILERDDLVTPSQVRRGIGRPSHLYSLTEGAQDLFPKHYDEFAISLISDILDVTGPEMLKELLEHRVNRMSRDLADRFQGLSFDQKIQEFVKLLNEQGSMGEAQKLEDGSYAVREFNCGIYQIAHAQPIICDYERKLVERALGAKVVVEECIAHGGQRCAYVIKEPAG